jgi:hypothetical protein
MGMRRIIHRTVVLAIVAGTATAGVMTPAAPAGAVDTPLVLGNDDLYFNTRTIGTTTTFDAYIYNNGTGSFGPLTVAGGEPPTSQFTMSENCTGATLAQNANCLMSYAFTPDGPGAFADTSSFTINGEEFTVHMAGFGAAANGTISGTVTLVNALPGSERNVYVTSLDGSDNHQFHSQPASYSVSVPPGTYCVSFGIGPWDGTLSSYPNKRHCLDGITPVTVAAGGAVTGIDATLTLASISGTLRDHNGAVIAAEYVYANSTAGTAENYDPTDAAGSFTIGNLPPGTYCVSPRSVTGDAVNGPCRAGTHRVDLALGANVTGADITLAPPEASQEFPGAISGTVTDPASAAVAGREVIAEPLGEYGYYGNATTAADGTYSLDGLPADAYCVYVTDDGSPLAGEHYADKSSCDTADPVIVGDTTVTNIDFALATGGTITGTVTDPTGNPATSGQVEAIKLGSYQSVDVNLGVGGSYTLAGLSPGQYCVIAYSWFGDFPQRTYGGGFSCERSVTPVTVAAGATTSAIDIQFATGGRIAGTVTFPPGFVPGQDTGRLLISTRDEDGDQSSYVDVDLAGYYETEALAPGLYCLSSRAPSPSLLVSRNIGSTHPEYCVGGTIAVADGATTTLDFAMELGGSISGWVISPDGTPDRDPGPRLEPWSGENDRVRPNGSFFQTGVSAGTYCVSINGFGLWLLDRTYDGVVSCDGDYTPVTVVAGQNTGGINFFMETGGRVSGTVTRSAGDGEDQVELHRLDAPQPAIVSSTYAVSSTTSQYNVEVPPGTYCVLVRPHPSTGNANRAYGGTPSCAGATPVVVPDQVLVTDIDIVLTRQIYYGLPNPARLLDTRAGESTIDGVAAGDGAIAGGTVRELPVGGRGGVPSGAAAVALNVTATNTTGPGYLAVFPCGQTTPTASNVNYTGAGQTTPNAVMSKLGTDGKVCVFALTTTDVIVDVAGYFPTADGFTPLDNPTRLLDTRPGEQVAAGGVSGSGAVTGGTVREVQIGSLAGVPLGAASVALNVTATNTTGPGYLAVFPCGQTTPTASNVNYTGAGQTTPNAVVSKLGTDGKVCVFALTTTDVVIDVAGYFPTADGFTPLDNPARLLDTRPGNSTVDGVAAGEGAIGGGSVLELQVGGRAGLPTGAASVALNVTATNTTGPGYLAVFPCGQTTPTASNVNYTAAGQTTPNAVIARLGTNGKVCVFALTTTDVVVDVAGFLPEGDGPETEQMG